MKLAELIAKALGQTLPLPDIEVHGVTQDNRRVKPGTVFVARQGEKVDGHRFVNAAVAAGAAAVVGKNRTLVDLPDGVPYIQVKDDRRAVASLAAAFYHYPSEQLKTFGVTGTDGKTTTSYLLHYLLQSEYATGLLSTASVKVGEKTLPPEGHFTTPEATEVQRLLAQFLTEGCTHAVIEASSHGFAWHRLDEVSFDIGVWTNLSPEHLDFHKTLEAYSAAKQTLMRRSSLSILNRDDAAYEAFAASANKSVSYGESSDADWQISGVEADSSGQRFNLGFGGGTYKAYLPMVGHYNVHNAVAALAAAQGAGVSLGSLLGRLETFKGVPGRMQVVQSSPFLAIVDFAHTPPALENALKTLRPVTKGRLIVVIGAAGERDPGKRAPLGEISARYADLALFTEEDSRSEDVNTILAEMAQGAISAGGEATQSYWCVGDRREAIRVAVSMAQRGDTLLFAGKGHEHTLERMVTTLSWNEVEEVERALFMAGYAPQQD